jgi:DNA-binding MarR family transcriptional regulator
MSQSSPCRDDVLLVRDTCLCLASQRAARVLARRFDRAFAPLGLTNGQFSMLLPLTGTWSPKLGELATFLAMDQTTLTSAAKTLEKKGWIELKTDETDARVRRPVLTPDGRSVLAQAIPIWKSEHKAVEDEAALPDARGLAAVLSALSKGLG